jgi:hypothetical protein
MILTIQFNREIGMKSLTPEGEFTFGIRVMRELLIDCRSNISSK